jgi:hypothetical protein
MASLREGEVTRNRLLVKKILRTCLAYWLLVGVGLVARRRYRPGRSCSSNGERQCSAFTVGRVMLDRMRVKAEKAIAAVAGPTGAAAPNWG